MKVWRMVGALSLCAMIATPAIAGPPSIDVYLSIRESDQAAPVIGDPGSTANGQGLEFVDRGLNQLVLDGTWQQFTWDLSNNSLIENWLQFGTPGGTPNVLDGNSAILDAIVFEASGPQPLTVWMDDFESTYDPAGLPPATSVTMQDWEGFAANDEVAFQEPLFSGSTAANLNPNVNYSGVDNSVAHSGSGSYQMRADIDFSNGFGYGIRYTTFGAGPIVDPNATVAIAQTGPGNSYDASSVSIWMRGLPVPEPTSMALLGLGGLALLRRRR